MNGVKANVTSLVKLFKLNEPEGLFYPCSNNNRNIINLSSYVLSESKKEFHLT